jgi:alpha-beta hydrolase superfamily lysophospholipase
LPVRPLRQPAAYPYGTARVWQSRGWLRPRSPRQLLRRSFPHRSSARPALSRDPTQVDTYIADPLCAFGLQPGSVASLKAAAPRTGDWAAIATIRPRFPLYVLSGTADPIHMGLAWLDKVVARYRRAGLDVTARYYDGGRHEMFKRDHRDEVLTDLLGWLDGVPVLARR